MHADAKQVIPPETQRPVPLPAGEVAGLAQVIDSHPVTTVHDLAVAARHATAANERARRVDEKLRRELGYEVCRALEDRRVIEIMLNPDGKLWVERLGEPMKPFGVMSASQAESLLATVAASLRTTLTRETRSRMRGGALFALRRSRRGGDSTSSAARVGAFRRLMIGRKHGL